jgi:predicted nucleic acid-binding protein
VHIDLPPGSTVLVDSSALVYLVEGSPGFSRGAAVRAFLDEAEAQGLSLVASTIAWMELLAKPLSEGRDDLALRYRALLADSSKIRLEVVDVAIAERAAALLASMRPRARGSISEADALHIATAIVIGASAVLSNDEAWRSVPGCPRLFLVDELAAALA